MKKVLDLLLAILNKAFDLLLALMMFVGIFAAVFGGAILIASDWDCWFAAPMIVSGFALSAVAWYLEYKVIKPAQPPVKPPAKPSPLKVAGNIFLVLGVLLILVGIGGPASGKFGYIMIGGYFLGPILLVLGIALQFVKREKPE